MKYRLAALVAVLAIVSAQGCRNKTETSGEVAVGGGELTSVAPLSDEERKIKNISDSEGLLQFLSSDMKALARSFKDSPPGSLDFVGPEIECQGIVPNDFFTIVESELVSSHDPVAASFQWPVADSSSRIPFSDIWKSILDGQRFEDTQIGVLKASFPDGPDELVMETKFEGRIRLADSGLIGVKGLQTLAWRRNQQEKWMLVSWIQRTLKIVAAKAVVFEDVTDRAFPDELTRTKLLRSTHQEMIVKRSGEISLNLSIKDARQDHREFSDWESVYQFPTASVVDIDQDGFDDLFVTDRWQSPQLMRNKGDGTFEDITEATGIDIPEFATCAYFVDFDNDGDSDLFVGFSVEASKYYVNDHGVFKPHEATNKVLEETRFVVACSVADVNGDGLLDIYLSTYAKGDGPIRNWINDITRPEERLKTRLRLERAHQYVDRAGPPNLLLMNRGDRFEWAKIDDVLKQYRNSYQSAWMDYDRDGDLDLYICNDFAPDVFLRNDTTRGDLQPTFVDVTQEIAPSMSMGFGMGASWGDFDNDGDLDLYVSNMYSKAGNRIVAQLDDVDERLRVSAHGNFLYENWGGRFEQIAGSDSTQQHVAIVGWSFGGQFGDFDNDGQLDLYVPSGFYSAPKAIANDKDL